jgi:ATP-binding cassette subfamily F protein 3
MLHVKNMAYRIEGRPLFENATAHLPKGHKAGLIGRNGTGKSTLFKLILNELQPDVGEVQLQKNARIGIVAQEVAASDQSIIDYVLSADQELAALNAELEQSPSDMRIAEIHSRLADIDAYSAPMRAAKILLGLGFDDAAQQKPLSAYSGGWRMRVALAAALFAEPDLLLLDEPTNHLDFESVTWLEKFLKSYPRTILLISHDRHFLNAVVDRIYHLSNKTITLYNGDYDFYEKTRREQMAIQQATASKQSVERARIKDFVDRFRAKASKARQVQSRIKLLEKFDPIVLARNDPSYKLDFPVPEQLAPPLISVKGATAGYGDNIVLKNVSLSIAPDDRIGLLGQNGNGKTTLAKILSRELDPLDGELFCTPKLRIGYFHQHQIENLRRGWTPLDHMMEVMPDLKHEKVRAHLGRFGFVQKMAETNVEKLSGGEKARLNFALMTAHNPQVLILDEPTNHLDIDVRESLIMAINAFEGAVIIISHDWHILELTTNVLWLVADQKVTPFDGDLSDYRKLVLSGGDVNKRTNADRSAEIKAKKQKKKKKK